MTLWRAEFGAGNPLMVSGDTREEARLQAMAWMWLTTGQWTEPSKLERA